LRFRRSEKEKKKYAAVAVCVAAQNRRMLGAREAREKRQVKGVAVYASGTARLRLQHAPPCCQSARRHTATAARFHAARLPPPVVVPSSSARQPSVVVAAVETFMF